jgi:hypothetical protein
MSKNQTNEYWKEYRRKNAERKREIEKKSRSREEYKIKKKETYRVWLAQDKLKNPHKWKARHAVREALKKGTLIKTPCDVCGIEKVEAHHPDHHKPLDVQWLCRLHHCQADFMKD